MTRNNDAVREGLKAEFEQMNSAPFAALGLTYCQAGQEVDYLSTGVPGEAEKHRLSEKRAEARQDEGYSSADGHPAQE